MAVEKQYRNAPCGVRDDLTLNPQFSFGMPTSLGGLQASRPSGWKLEAVKLGGGNPPALLVQV